MNPVSSHSLRSATPTTTTAPTPQGSRRCGWRNGGLFFMTVDQKAQVRNAREEKPMSSKNDEQNSAEVTQPAELHTPAEWCALAAVEVLDPDGWRVDGKSWDDPIDADEFKTRFHGSTWRLAPLNAQQINEEISWKLLRRPSSDMPGSF